jgi:type I restriction enzyme S subunit
MASEWPRVVISDVCELIVDCVNKTAPVVKGPTPFKMIRTPNVKNGVVSTDTCRFVESDTFEKWTRRAAVKVGDVLLTREAPLGEVGIVKSEEKLFLGQRLMQYRANPQLLDSKFLLYSFLSHDLQHQFSVHEGSGSVVSHIRVGDCLKFELNLPPLDEQRRISSALGSIDQKIELNRQANQCLEKMAQALFKSWFVDFDPVIDNALAAGNPIPDELQDRAEHRKQQLAKPDHKPLPEDILQLFPSEFELTEALGWVPKGWECLAFDDFCNAKQGKYIPKNKMIKQSDDEYLYPVWGGNGVRGYTKEKIYSESIVVLTCRGSNCGLIEKTHGGSWVSNISFACTPTLGSVNFLYVLFNNLDFGDCISGSAQPQITYTALKTKQIKYPVSRDLIDAFSVLVDEYYTLVFRNELQSLTLSKLRDILLPKLISGELQLPSVALADVEQQLAETIV